MILYKVVGKQTRHCSNWTLATRNGTLHKLHPDYEMIEHKTFFREYPELKPYYPRYLKNSIIHKAPGSIGLCCFKEIRFIDAFVDNHPSLRRMGKMIKVRVNPEDILGSQAILGGAAMIYNLRQIATAAYKCTPPPGTVFVRKLKVLE